MDVLSVVMAGLSLALWRVCVLSSSSRSIGSANLDW